MDSIRVSEAPDPGSIPGEATSLESGETKGHRVIPLCSHNKNAFAGNTCARNRVSVLSTLPNEF